MVVNASNRRLVDRVCRVQERLTNTS
jgi:hypothetical protein